MANPGFEPRQSAQMHTTVEGMKAGACDLTQLSAGCIGCSTRDCCFLQDWRGFVVRTKVPEGAGGGGHLGLETGRSRRGYSSSVCDKFTILLQNIFMLAIMDKNQKFAVFLWVGLLIPFLFCGLAQAQFEDGSLVGTIRDSSGAAVAGAAIQVVNTATGIQNTATSNGSGDYEVLSLRVGVYKITATAPGFAAAIADKISISVGSRQRIDLTVQPGQTQSTVEVSDVALQLETESSQRGQTITNYQSEALPLVTRNYSDLLGLVTGSRQAPTAATTSSINSLVRQGAYNINGQRSVFNNFLLDGMDNNAYGESNQGFDNQIIAVPPDSVAQFSIVTNNESAEYGRSSGATINVASASGTNQYHATLYEFLRNTDLNADGFFKPNVVSNTGSVTPFKKPAFNRNQFGMNFGGPILRDKLFYFLDYEGFRQTLTPLTVLTLPTQDELNGNLVVP